MDAERLHLLVRRPRESVGEKTRWVVEHAALPITLRLTLTGGTGPMETRMEVGGGYALLVRLPLIVLLTPCSCGRLSKATEQSLSGNCGLGVPSVS